VAPYRTVEHDDRAVAPRDPGIVGDVIAQFADSFAFLRELVQNAIDAGTPSVEVRIVHDAAANVVRASVRDRGEGMTRDIVENQLLVLFRSTKERDDSKIGKFGIGFASVLAPKPNVVVVHTARDGRRLTVHLHPDLTYELFDAGPATQPGTTVEVEIAVAADDAREFAQRSRQALERWCRHATVPIQLVAEPAAISARIDRPLALDGALVEVRGTTDDGQLVAVVGVLPEAAPGPYAGFFNHGLTLHETTEPLLGRLGVKIQDPRLGHTLSRDNVRRDDRFHRAISFAQSLAEHELPAAVARELAAAANAAVRDRYYALAQGIEAAGIELRGPEWVFPLVDSRTRPRGDHGGLRDRALDNLLGDDGAPHEPAPEDPSRSARAISAGMLGRRAWASPGPSRLTAALAAAGVPVLHAPDAQAQGWLVARARNSAGCRVVDIALELTAVEIIEASPRDLALLDMLGELLAAAHRAPSQIALARLSGRCAGELAVTGGVEDAIHAASGDHAPYVLDLETAKRSPFAMLRRPSLVLSISHVLVNAARRGDPRLGASHLARALLLHYRLLDVERSRAILDHTLARLGVT